MSKPKQSKFSNEQIRLVTNFIKANLARPKISVADLAHLVGMSEFHFARRFKETLGESPHRFVWRCRIERARELMLADDQSLADIALQVGFADHSHLTREFKRVTGFTPSEWRKRKSFWE